MRIFFRKIHLWLSLPLGFLVCVICLSGAILVFERDITQALQRELYTVTPPSGQARPLSPSELAARINGQLADPLHLSSLQLSGNTREAAFASFSETGKRQLSVDPYTGEVKGWTKSYPFFQTVKKIHRWLLDPPKSKGQKSAGKMIVGITTSAMVLILVSGLVIWIPRTRKALGKRLGISVTKGWRRFWYDCHAATGFYCTVFLLVMALTGLTWSFGWYRTAAYSLFGADMKTSVHNDRSKGESNPGKGKQQNTAHPGHEFEYSVWDTAVSEIRSIYPSYRTLTLNARNIQIIPERSAIRKADVITIDPGTGSVLDVIHYEERPRSQILKGWFYAFHTGSWGGTVTKVLYFLAALLGGILPLNGYYLWWKRTRGTPQGRPAKKPGIPAAADIPPSGLHIKDTAGLNGGKD